MMTTSLLDVTVNDYNGDDIESRITQLVEAGHAVTVNGERLDTSRGYSRVVNIHQNGTLAFRVIARDGKKSNIIYAKLGARVVVAEAVTL